MFLSGAHSATIATRPSQQPIAYVPCAKDGTLPELGSRMHVKRFYEELKKMKAQEVEPDVPAAEVNFAEKGSDQDVVQVCYHCAGVRLHQDKFWFTKIVTCKSHLTGNLQEFL